MFKKIDILWCCRRGLNGFDRNFSEVASNLARVEVGQKLSLAKVKNDLILKKFVEILLLFFFKRKFNQGNKNQKINKWEFNEYISL